MSSIQIFGLLPYFANSVVEPEPVGAEVFLAKAGADLKFELEPEPIFLGRLRLLFLASEKRNYLKMFFFHCILDIFLYNK